MSNILKITATTTLEVSSDILNKDAGALVKDAIVQVTPVLVEALKAEFAPKPSPTPKAKE